MASREEQQAVSNMLYFSQFSTAFLETCLSTISEAYHGGLQASKTDAVPPESVERYRRFCSGYPQMAEVLIQRSLADEDSERGRMAPQEEVLVGHFIRLTSLNAPGRLELMAGVSLINSPSLAAAQQ